MKLKTLKEEETHSKKVCAVVKCNKPTEVIMAITPPEHGLCEAHWLEYCKE